MGDISVDIFLETLKQLLTTSNLDFTTEEKYQLQSLEVEIKNLSGFLEFVGKKRNKHQEVMDLVKNIRNVVFNAENAVDLFIVLSKDVHASNSLHEHMDLLFLDLKRVRKDIKNLGVEVKQIYDEMGNTSLHHFMKTLEQLLTTSDLDFTREENFQLQFLKQEIKDLMGLLNIVEKKRNKHSKVMNLVMLIKDVVSNAEKAVKLFIVDVSKDDHASNSRSKKEDHASNSLREPMDHLFRNFERVRKDIKNLGAEVKQIYSEKMYDISEAAVKSLSDSSTGSRGGSGPLGGSNPPKLVGEKVVVGFEEEVAKLLKDLLDPKKYFVKISILGLGGCGKTTLVREVYDHPLISTAFEIRAWVVVSQDYDQTMRRDLLIDIFKSIFPKKQRDYENRREAGLEEKLYKILEGKRYLIVMDNVWGIEVWNDIRRSFPRDKGSRVVFTSRQPVTKHKYDVILHYVKPLSENCSWELLEAKVFGKKRCPPELVEIGKQIAKKCQGLPLAIVTIAGILATEKNIPSVWQKIAEHVSSTIAKKHDGCMELLELSYNHLPLHLKACFLYIGAHPENYEISAHEVTWLWIAEGFVQQNEEGISLEAVAEGYLLDLTSRNLVMIAKGGSMGKIKTCCIHDLLRELCLMKAKEDNFSVQINGDDSSITSAINKHRRLFIFRQFFDKFFFSRPYPQNLRSLLCLGSRHSRIELYMSFFVETFKLLRVFSFVVDECRGEILRGQLVHLRYLAVQLSQNVDFPLPFHLFNLETLTIQTSCLKGIELSSHIFKMVRLRNLYTKQGIFTYHVYDDENEGNMLDSLQTLDRMCLCEHCLCFLKRTPNLEKLGLIGDPDKLKDDVLVLLDLEFLKRLKILHVESVHMASTGLKLPPTLTRLSLKQTNLKWEQLTILLQALPSLEVLKLLPGACSGPVWDTSKFKFPQLKYLKLDGLDIKEWKTYIEKWKPDSIYLYQFRRLEIIVIRHCKELKRIPNTFDNLGEINVEYSNQSVEESAKAIQEAYLRSYVSRNVNLILRHNAL